MQLYMLAALALTAASSLSAQAPAPATTPATDLSYSTPLAGTWTYSTNAGGSSASFVDSAGRPQVTLQCTRATRRVTISKPASAAASTLFVWTSSGTRNVAARFDAATARVSAELGVTDPLLDAIAFSRGRIGVSVAGTPALVVPAWPEPARVVEDCRT